MDTTEAIRDALRRGMDKDAFVSYELGVKLHRALERIAKRDYRPLCAPQVYLQFLSENECSFSRCHPQSVNSPWVWEMFCVASQHVYGDTIEQALDHAMKRIAEGSPRGLRGMVRTRDEGF